MTKPLNEMSESAVAGDLELFRHTMAQIKRGGDRDYDACEPSSLWVHQRASRPTVVHGHATGDGDTAPPATHTPLSRAAPARVWCEQTTTDRLLFARVGLQRKIIRRLRRGEYPCQATLDLHGLTQVEALEQLQRFLDEALTQQHHCLLIIHGQGRNSTIPGGVLKPLTIRWLKTVAEVQAFCSARPNQGGYGAMYVLLKTTMPRRDGQ